MIPYLLRISNTSHQSKLIALIALKLTSKDNSQHIEFTLKECREGLKIKDKEVIHQLFYSLQQFLNENDEPLFANINCTERNLQISLTEEGVLKFSMFKLFFKTRENIEGFLQMSTKANQAFWCLLQENDFNSFSIDADKLGKCLGVDKYRLTQGKNSNSSMLERISKVCRKASVLVTWKLQNEHNIKNGFIFIVERHDNNRNIELLLQKLNQIKLSPEEETAKRKTLLNDFLENKPYCLDENKQLVIEKIRKIQFSNEEYKILLFKALEFLIK